MRKAIGLVIVLWALSRFFSTAFEAFNTAATETFNTVTIAAKISQERLSEK